MTVMRKEIEIARCSGQGVTKCKLPVVSIQLSVNPIESSVIGTGLHFTVPLVTDYSFYYTLGIPSELQYGHKPM
jgi:hypothetical protein